MAEDRDAPDPATNLYHIGMLSGRITAVEGRQDRHETWMGSRFSSLESKFDGLDGKVDEIRGTLAVAAGISRTAGKTVTVAWAAIMAAGGVAAFIINHYWH